MPSWSTYNEQYLFIPPEHIVILWCIHTHNCLEFFCWSDRFSWVCFCVVEWESLGCFIYIAILLRVGMVLSFCLIILVCYAFFEWLFPSFFLFIRNVKFYRCVMFHKHHLLAITLWWLKSFPIIIQKKI